MRIVFLFAVVLLMICSMSCIPNSFWNTESYANNGSMVHITEHDVLVSQSKELGGDHGVILMIDDNVIADNVYTVIKSLLFSRETGNIWLKLPGGDRIQILYGDVDYYYRNRRSDIQITCEIELEREKLSYRCNDGDKVREFLDSVDLEKVLAQLGPDQEIEIRCTKEFPFGRMNKICQSLVRQGFQKVYFAIVVK